MPKYLYGASVHAIQQFIFETGKLKEIVGASELVEKVCTQLFQDSVSTTSTYLLNNRILSAAGRIIYRFEERADCAALVRSFPQFIKEQAPTLQLSQAVVEIKGNGTKAELDQLDNLLDAQRNRAVAQHGLGLMITKRSSRTGGAGYGIDPTEPDKPIDRTQDTKLRYFREAGEDFTNDRTNGLIGKILPSKEDKRTPPIKIDEIAKKGQWLAIVHADGNGLGKIIQQFLAEDSLKDNAADFLKNFSEQLDMATIAAAKEAYEKTILNAKGLKDKIPLRPVLLGGDDLTMIMRADLALDFTAKYLACFEQQTKVHFKNLKPAFPYLQDGLTACAGIAFIKPNYPFHYGVSLSDGLTKYAKNKSNRSASCLAFHKVQSSFIGDYKSIIERELTAVDNISFANGPYFLTQKAGYNTVGELKEWVRELQKIDAPKTSLREWMTIIQSNKPAADQLLDRIISLHPRYKNPLKLSQLKKTKKIHLYDALMIDSVFRMKS